METDLKITKREAEIILDIISHLMRLTREQQALRDKIEHSLAKTLPG